MHQTKQNFQSGKKCTKQQKKLMMRHTRGWPFSNHYTNYSLWALHLWVVKTEIYSCWMLLEKNRQIARKQKFNKTLKHPGDSWNRARNEVYNKMTKNILATLWLLIISCETVRSMTGNHFKLPSFNRVLWGSSGYSEFRLESFPYIFLNVTV